VDTSSWVVRHPKYRPMFRLRSMTESNQLLNLTFFKSLLEKELMSDSVNRHIHSQEFLSFLMKRQLTLSITCAALFLVALLGLPLANYVWPEVMATRVGGFTLSWLILGVLFFPYVWLISFVFIKRSMALEEEEVRRVQELDADSKS
jgi:uncharacterized membrane protein (DUF485 family)